MGTDSSLFCPFSSGQDNPLFISVHQQLLIFVESIFKISFIISVGGARTRTHPHTQGGKGGMHLKRPEEGICSPEAGVTASCEPFDVGAKN